MNELQSMNEMQETLHDKLQEFERDFVESCGLEISAVHMSTETYPAYCDYTYHIVVCLYGEDEWNSYWHYMMCKEFGVALADFRIKYTHSENLVYSCNYIEYVYSSNRETGLKFEERMAGFYYAPSKTIFNLSSEKVRVLTHRILNACRELDNLDLEYEDCVDKDCLATVLEQLNSCIEHKDILERK